MEKRPMENIISAIIGAIVGAICGGWIAWIIADKNTDRTILATNSLNRIQEFNNAAANFHAAFIDVIIFLKFNQPNMSNSMNIDRVNKVLNDFTIQHLQAIIKFKPFLSKNKRLGIDKAWDEYCYPDGAPTDSNGKDIFLFKAYYSIEDAEGSDKAREKALEKINNILSFANFK